MADHGSDRGGRGPCVRCRRVVRLSTVEKRVLRELGYETRYGVRVERNVLIPLEDGVSLAADLYLPDAPGRHPALVSFYPYRKDDLIGASAEHARTYLTERGYASLLVDFRGTGSSEGDCHVTFDTVREGADGAQVVEWAAGQE